MGPKWNVRFETSIINQLFLDTDITIEISFLKNFSIISVNCIENENVLRSFDGSYKVEKL